MDYLFDFVKLDKSDMSTVLDYLKKSAEWLNDKGIDYWQNWQSPSPKHTEWIMEGLIAGQFYMARQRGINIGIFRLQYEDEMFWGKREDKAGYVHSLTVERNSSGQKLGYLMLGDIEKMAAGNGCEYIRLDCGVHVEGLIRYYKNYGFKDVGRAMVAGEELMLLEKRITPIESI
ncbi:MAG: GNAT family N-acetyltransferase [Clostridia bacterium]|nr:GNAT family N-acetyltransferase [Clostridia bacterium]